MIPGIPTKEEIAEIRFALTGDPNGGDATLLIAVFRVAIPKIATVASLDGRKTWSLAYSRRDGYWVITSVGEPTHIGPDDIK